MLDAQNLQFSPMLTGIDVLDGPQAHKVYGMDTGGACRALRGALQIAKAEQVQQVLAWANAHQQKLWPISSGRNFGYGTALPVHENAWVLDLSRLKRITFSAQAQTIDLEAGVTQQDLAKYLDDHRLAYLVPTTGAGPGGSLLGNALDGGYGLTPVSDHFEALARVRGYWGTGLPFDHTYAGMGAVDMAGRWPQGLGLDYRSLLRQGNLGIVTSATLQLARKPEASALVLLQWSSHDQFLRAQDELSRLMEDVPQLVGLLSMTALRTLAAMPGGPLAQAPRGAQRAAYLENFVSKSRMAAWTSLGTLYGSRSSLKGASKDISRRLSGYGCKVLCLGPTAVRRLLLLRPLMPAGLRAKVGSLANALTMLEGRPVPEFLQLAYALEPRSLPMDATRNPAKDGQGILWYAPLVPLTPTGLQEYIQTVEPILAQHGFDSLLAATARNSRVSTATLPLLFNKTPEDIERARNCYQDLVRTGLARGLPPYRLGIEYMDILNDHQDEGTHALHAQLKAALDPSDVIAPGRYMAPQHV